MKIFRTFLLTGLLGATFATLATAQPVFLRPDNNAPTVGELKSGDPRIAPSEPARLNEEQKEAGWEAISFLDDFRGFVRRVDLTKDLEVSPGALVYHSAKADPEQVLVRASAKDLFEVERLSGDWVEVSFRKPITGFVRAGGQADPETAAPAYVTQAPVEDSQMQIFEDVPAPKAEKAQKPVISSRNAMPSDGVLRLFEGRLTKTRSFLGRGQPYQFQVLDPDGNRIAYLDLNKLLITTPLDSFLDQHFQFYGRAETVEGRRDFVIRVEHMRMN